ncbi:hypothetical protein [Xylocopilactobacillus apis]|uniref:Uncharacterized protein n=1 Tax=Xylocopilactobacillus apis TaxID=2932183 RepID=A0AAU9CZM1_9LACO|nr:hypothetical protein [Xylocopilactobacillus apis]BDR55706.1 hypothetical protein KIMC2_02680 [Xylocopilactobacillus apis]
MEMKLQLNMEMHNVGEFLFDGCEAIYYTGNYILDYEIFNALYNISVGIERMQKIILLLDDSKIQDDQRKFLNSHNVEMLRSIISKIYNLNFNKEENELLNLLRDFYKNGRYNYLDKEYEGFNWSVNRLNVYFEKINKPQLNRIHTQYHFLSKSKESIMRTLSTVILKYIKLLKDISDNQGIFIVETESTRKLSVFVYCPQKSSIFDYFRMVDIAKNELYYFLWHRSISKKMLPPFSPINFDVALIPDFLSETTLTKVKWDLIGEVESYYCDFYEDNEDEIEKRKNYMFSFWDIISQYLDGFLQ